MSNSEKTPFYKKVWFMLLISVLFPIVGIILMWKFKGNWNKVIKGILTAIASVWLGLLLIFCAAMGSEPIETPESNITTTAKVESSTALTTIPTTIITEESTTVPSTKESTTAEATEKSTTSTTKKETTTEKKTTTTQKQTTTTKKATTTQKPTTKEPTTQKPTTSQKVTTTKNPTTNKVTTTKKVTTTAEQNNSIKIYRTASGECYHYENPCGRGTYYEVSLSEAKAAGLRPCEKCVLN